MNKPPTEQELQDILWHEEQGRKEPRGTFTWLVREIQRLRGKHG